MGEWTRRDWLKTSFAGSAATAAGAAGLEVKDRFGQAGQETRASGEEHAGREDLLPRERLLLDFGWRFRLGNAASASEDLYFGGGKTTETFAKSGHFIPAARSDYDDSSWRSIDLPHDWAVELPFEDAEQLTAHGFHPLGRAFAATSIGWYRRVFELPAGDSGKRLSVEFDGVFRDCMVILNGHYLGRNFSGYAPFCFDVSDFANYGAPNVLLVRVDATLNEGWFYEGAGIYRHVWLTKTHPVHVRRWGTFVRSEIQQNGAAVRIQTEIENEGDTESRCRIVSTIFDGNRREIGRAASELFNIAGRKDHTFEQETVVTQPAMWSSATPNLYTLLTEVEDGGSIVDRYRTTFGIRTFAFDADQGFSLNGEPLKIKGTCNHQDHAGVGAALPDRIQYYRIERLKEMGSNAYRTSHNPPTPELLDACDRLGMLVMDETRMFSSNPEGLSELERMIRRDRNHPSIVIWSLANEEPEQGTARGARIMTTMKRAAKQLDPTRPVTAAMNGGWGQGVSHVVDVQGFNYKNGGIDEFHRKFPTQPTIGTETASTVCTRGIYQNDKQKGYVSAYDRNFPPWAATAETWWKMYDERRFIAGGFAWTGFDYRGEPTPYGWPCVSSHFGIMDTCGFPKDNYFYYKAWWGAGPVLHLFPHWNWQGKEGQEIEVWCHSNLERVELFLNGQALGARDVAHASHVQWLVKYAPGTLEARGFKGNQQVMMVRRETTTAAAKLVLKPDRRRILADGEDVSMVALEVQDQQGRVVPDAGNQITFEVSGTGRLIGVGNGDPSCHESDKGKTRSAFNGLCMAIVQSSQRAGELVIRASAPGLSSGTIAVQCDAVKLRPAVPARSTG